MAIRTRTRWIGLLPALGVCAGLAAGCDESPSAPSAPVEVTLTSGSDRGSVRSDGQVLTTITQAGDVALAGGSDEVARQAFLTFSLASIPAGATINSVRIDFGVGASLASGLPFGPLGCLRAYPVTAFPLDAGDFFSGALAGSIASWCTLGELDAEVTSDGFRSVIQNGVNTSAAAIDVRLNFDAPTNNDGDSDLVSLGSPTLVVNYTGS